MKKFITFAVIMVSSAYYACLPFVVAKAGELPNDAVMANTVIAAPITAYASVPDETSDHPFITASGNHVRDGIVASNFLPFGTKIKIPALFGDKIFTVEDRMNRMFSNRVDIWMPTVNDAVNFGIHNTNVVVVSEPTSTSA